MRKTIETYEMTRWDAHLGERVIYTRHNSQPMTGMQDIERTPFGGTRYAWRRVTMRDDARTRYGVQIAVDKVYSDDRPADYTDDKTWVWYYMTAREAAAKALLLCRECGITDPYITGDVGGMCTSRDCEMIAAGATWDDLCTEWYKAAATVTTRERGGYNDYCETVYTYSAEGDTAPQEAITMTQAITFWEIVDRARKVAESDDYYFETFGVRWQVEPFELGPIGHISHNWDDGTDTGEELDGICALDVTNLGYYKRSPYYGEHIAILGSYGSHSGEDLGEIVMQDAEVLEIIC